MSTLIYLAVCFLFLFLLVGAFLVDAIKGVAKEIAETRNVFVLEIDAVRNISGTLSSMESQVSSTRLFVKDYLGERKVPCKSCAGEGEVVQENPLLKSIRKTLDAGVHAR